jgi:hypothetical protein
MMDNVELLLKKYLRERNSSASGRGSSGDVPEMEDFVLYCQDRLEGAALERVQRCLVANRWAQELVLEAKRLMEEKLPDQKVPSDLVENAKALMKDPARTAPCPHCGKSITPFKRSAKTQKWTNLLWLLLMAGSFALSFIFRKYFMQFLVVTALAGVKWIVEMRASKTQIMIYRALSDDAGKPAHRLKEFQEKK